MIFRVLFATAFTVSAAATPAADQGEALRAAAAAGQLALVRTLLDAGVPVDAPARHGNTALLFAAGKGHLDIVRLLVEHGADVNAKERFFGATPLGEALQGKYTAVALFLLEKGAIDAASALDDAVEQANLELAKAALATGRIDRLDLLAARRRAALIPAGPIRDLLAAASPTVPQRAPFAPSAERLRACAGRYRVHEKDEATVTVSGAGLVLSLPGQAGIALVGVALDRFETKDGDTRLDFGGRGGLVEGARLNRGGEITSLSVITADPKPLKAATRPVETQAFRDAPRPWPSFRGTDASGNGDGQGAPLTWNVSAGQNIRFRTAVPGISLSSPIIWGDRIFVTSAVSGSGDKTFRTGLYGDGTSVDDDSEHSFRIYALDAKTGAILWEREVYRGRPPVKRHMKSSQANATPTTDGKRVVALFGTVGLLVAYDFGGKPLWKRDIGILECNDPQAGSAQWGHASSPILYRDLVVVQGDRVKDSFLAAYRASTGEEAWRVARDEPSTWATPNVLRAPGGDELVTNGQKVRAYDPATGALLWTLGPNSEVVVATPVVGEGMVFVTAGYPPVRPVYAIRPGQRGDLSLPEGKRASAAIAWSHARNGTYIPTPILYKGHLYTCNNNGILTCYRADTGEQVYQTRLGETAASFASSPVAADGRIYFPSETGEVFVLRAGPDYELLATNSMDEVVMATPAISDGLLVVRTLGHVVGIAEPRAPGVAK
jgi:outer membrane protein assembly factor BamB